jgi:hypothetical protein
MKWAYKFVKRHSQQLHLVRADLLEQARKDAWNYENISKWFDTLSGLLLAHLYDSRLVFQLDETSLCVKRLTEAKKVVPYGRRYIPSLKLPPIYRCTALFIIKLSEESLTPHIIFAKSKKLPIERLHPKHSILHENSKGWMEKTLFETIMREHILKEIQSIRNTMTPEQCHRALIILDGHSSRQNRHLWDEFSKQEVDVIILPAHTSHYLQPLDVGVNGVFKKKIAKLQFPPSKSTLMQYESFITEVEDAIDFACLHKTVRHSWRDANVCAGDPKAVLAELEKVPRQEAKPKKKRGFPISGEILTDPHFLQQWKEYEDHSKKKPSALSGHKREESSVPIED